MLTIDNKKNCQIVVPTRGKIIEQLLQRQWLLTNDRGGYSASTIAACNTSRYHALLTGSLAPKPTRIVALSNTLEYLICDGRPHNLSTFQFDNNFAPSGLTNLHSFRKDIAARFDYQVESTRLTRSLYLHPTLDILAITYDFTQLTNPVELAVRPFVALRNLRHLQKSWAHLTAFFENTHLLIRHESAETCQLFFRFEQAHYHNDPQWWFNFTYTRNQQNGRKGKEDLWTPGFYKLKVTEPTRLTLWANFTAPGVNCQLDQTNLDSIIKELENRRRNLDQQTRARKLVTLLKLL